MWSYCSSTEQIYYCIAPTEHPRIPLALSLQCYVKIISQFLSTISLGSLISLLLTGFLSSYMLVFITFSRLQFSLDILSNIFSNCILFYYFLPTLVRFLYLIALAETFKTLVRLIIQISLGCLLTFSNH